MMRKKRKIFDIVNNTILLLVAFVCVYPFLCYDKNREINS